MSLRPFLALVLCGCLTAAESATPEATVTTTAAALAAGQPVSWAGPAPATPRLNRLTEALVQGQYHLRPLDALVVGDRAVVLTEGRLGTRRDRFGLYLALVDGAWRLRSEADRAGPQDAELAAWVQERTTPVAPAAGALATWMMGTATIGGQAVRPGAAVTLGHPIANAARPGRLVLNALAGSSLALGPQTTITLTEEAVPGGTDLVIDLTDGVVQVDLRSKGSYAHVRVRGLTSDVQVMGTIFLVQRISQDDDYIAQVEGTVQVRPRNGGPGLIELTNRQGLEVSRTGLGTPEPLATRPQLTNDRLAEGDIRRQALKASGDGGWSTDAVADQAPPTTSEAEAQDDGDAITMSEAAAAASASATGERGRSSTAATTTPSRRDLIGTPSPGLGSRQGTGGGFSSADPAQGTGALPGGSGGSAGASGDVSNRPLPITGHPGLPIP